MACLLENRGKRCDAVAYASRAVNAGVDKENLHGLMNFPGLLEGVEPYYFLTARAVPLKARWFAGWFLGPSQDQTASFNGKLPGSSTVAFSFAKLAFPGHRHLRQADVQNSFGTVTARKSEVK